MSVDLTETETTTHCKKQKSGTSQSSELYIMGLFEKKDLPSEHKDAKIMHEITCLNCPGFARSMILAQLLMCINYKSKLDFKYF
jgi:hypothetical protein